MTIAVTTLLMAPCTPYLIRSLRLGELGSGALGKALLDGVKSPNVTVASHHHGVLGRRGGGADSGGSGAFSTPARPEASAGASVIGAGVREWIPPELLLAPNPPTTLTALPLAGRTPSHADSLDSDDEPPPPPGDRPTKVGSPTHVRRVLRRLERAYLKPVFGGRGCPPEENTLPEAAWGISLFFTPWDSWERTSSERDLEGRLREAGFSTSD